MRGEIMEGFELTEERIKDLRKYVGCLYRDQACLRMSAPFEDIFQTAMLHVIETKSDEGLSSWLIWQHMKVKEYYEYNNPILFSKLAPTSDKDDKQDTDNFIESLAPAYEPYDEEIEAEHKVIYDLSEELYKKREDKRLMFLSYCFGEKTDGLDFNERTAIRRKVFNNRKFIIDELYKSGSLSFDDYEYYFNLSEELQKLPNLAKHLKMTTECVNNRKCAEAHREKRLAAKRAYNNKIKQARLNSAKEITQ